MSDNPLGLKRFGPVTLYVEDAKSESERLSKLLAMDIGYVSEDESPVYGLQSDDVNFILDGSEKASAEAKQYGNHIKEIGIVVEDVSSAFDQVKKKTDNESWICDLTGNAYLKAPHDGELFFKLLEDGQDIYPRIKKSEQLQSKQPFTFNRIDHIVTNTQQIQPVIDYMQDVFGMKKVNEFTIRVENDDFMASLYSEVMGIYGTEHPVLFPVNEPLAGDDESQIPAQLREVTRSHAQHIALATDDIISSIQRLRGQGLEFLEFRNEQHAERYYHDVPKRLGKISVGEAMEKLRELGILVDKCGEGYLLQLFSTRLFPDKSVPFVEIIQRASDVIGCFGDGNFAALAESLEWAMRQGASSA